MSEQRIHTGADAAATSSDADPTEGQGLQEVSSHGDLLTGGGDGPSDAQGDRLGSAPTPQTEGSEEGDAPDTEGARYLRDTQDIAAQQGGVTDPRP